MSASSEKKECLDHGWVSARIRRVLDAEADAIRGLSIDSTYAHAVELLFACSGKIVATGMGKAGFVARKFAAILSSTASPAVFIHPAEALHGDLGMLAEGDCIVAFSTSGKTREILEFIEFSRHMKVGAVIGITSHSDSGLRSLVDVIIDMGVIDEPCPPRIDSDRQHGGDGGCQRRACPGPDGAQGRHPRRLRAASSWRLSRQAGADRQSATMMNGASNYSSGATQPDISDAAFPG